MITLIIIILFFTILRYFSQWGVKNFPHWPLADIYIQPSADKKSSDALVTH